MAHALLTVNPFDVLLRLHQTGIKIDSNFSFWIRSFKDPPIRTTRALVENCPRVDWLFWYLEQCVYLNLIDSLLVVDAGIAVRHHLDLIVSGHTYSAVRNAEMPHTEGLRVLRVNLQRVLYNGG